MLALGPKFAVRNNRKDLPLLDLITDVEGLASSVQEPEKQSIFRGKAAIILSNQLNKIDHNLTTTENYLQASYKKCDKFLKENTELIIL